MKLILILAGFLVIAASVFADYKWRRWMASRRAESDQEVDRRA